jgi:hypothetical protein
MINDRLAAAPSMVVASGERRVEFNMYGPLASLVITCVLQAVGMNCAEPSKIVVREK